MASVALMSPSISSQTLTASPTHHLPLDLHPSSDQALLSTLSSSSYTFLQPPPSLHTAALVLAKRYLDPLAASVSKTKEGRLQEKRRKRKRKRGEVDYGSTDEILHLEQVHLEGFGIQQVWEQARRVLDAGRNEIERSLVGQAQPLQAHGPVAINRETHDKNDRRIKQVRFQNDNGLQASDGEDNYVERPELDLENAPEGGELSEEEYDINDGSIGSENNQDSLVDGDDIEVDDMEMEVDDISGQDQADSFIPDKHGLNDGFFSIDEFNRTSEFLEQQDARGDPNDGAASDEEEIDWDADPMTRPGPSNDIQETDGDTQGNDNDSEEDGPTFGNANLNAPDTSSDDDDDDDTGIQQNSNTNDVKYADFFEPPPRALSKNSRHRALPKTQPPPQANGDDIQRTISAVRRDLFEDDLSCPSDSDGDDVSTALPGSQNLSSHQKRQAAISAQIRQLEAANVAKRDWTLSGEARAAERPINSLLEEDLDFERVGKPVTVVTKEVSEDIEALVKRRILAREFDEVIRRRPGLVTQTPDIRRGRTELDDTRDKRGLGELYEEEHLQAIDPLGHPDKRDEQLKKQHSEIERLWKDVSSKLDALSSFNYRPKPPEVNVTVVTDAPAIRMEDARPSGVGGVGDVGGGESRLAPQEVYKPGEEKVREEIVAGGKPVGREEMTREEKLRRRRREKERIKKAGGPMKKDGGVKTSGKSSKREDRDGVLSDLKKGGVKVIGKRGDVKDVEGKAVKITGNGKGAGGFKL